MPIEHEARGVVMPDLTATMASKAMARVVSVTVEEGQPIRQGQVLVRLDARELAAGVEVARANLKAAQAGVGNAATAAEMERKASQARIGQAQAAEEQARAALASAQARLDLAQAGPRSQERAQARLAVTEAKANLDLAKIELDRVTGLAEQGAIALRQVDLAQNAFTVAKAQYDMAVESEKIAEEGTRSQELRAAREAVAQAKAGVRQAQAAVVQAKASAMAVQVRARELEVARAQASQSVSQVNASEVGLSYATVTAPFDGRVVQRLSDPGAMAAPGVPLLVVEGGQLRLEATVPERVLPAASVGAFATVRIDALGGKPIRSKVVEVVPKGDPGTHTFTVKYELPNLTGLKSGMFGRALIQTAIQDRILIPREATWEREGLHYVYTANPEGIVRLRIITIGAIRDSKVEVLSGLAKGDRLVVGDRSKVFDGAKVEEL